MQPIFTQEDSKRVADALIEKIDSGDFDISYALRSVILDAIRPSGWRKDWFPLMIQDMCDEIRRGVIGAAYEGANKIRND